MTARRTKLGKQAGSSPQPDAQPDALPALTADQMREVDHIMIEELHIELVQMMENAGRNLAHLTIRLFDPSSALVLVGPGGNGGGGLVAARHLANRGVEVSVTLSHAEAELAPVPAHQLDVVRRIGIPVLEEPQPVEVVIDALIGYGLRGDPRGRTAQLIEWVNAQPLPTVALDAPSGLDVTTGRAASTCVRASATLTLALPKVGLLRAPDLVGRLFVADISVPPSVYERFGITVPALFARNQIVEVKT